MDASYRAKAFTQQCGSGVNTDAYQVSMGIICQISVAGDGVVLVIVGLNLNNWLLVTNCLPIIADYMSQ